jgi:hypothetical protein
LVWARAAAKKLDGFDDAAWHKRLEEALGRAENGSPYLAGMLEMALGRQAAARAHFEDAILLPDRRLAHHLSRLAMAGTAIPE